MPTDGDKIAAATLAAKLLEMVPQVPNDERIALAIDLYQRVLKQLADPMLQPE